MLNVLDEFTHECLAIRAARKLKAIRASSPPGLHQQAGHMTAPDQCCINVKKALVSGAVHT
jgi:hypothetical protein